jgi:hypothetical protein
MAQMKLQDRKRSCQHCRYFSQSQGQMYMGHCALLSSDDGRAANGALAVAQPEKGIAAKLMVSKCFGCIHFYKKEEKAAG